MTVKAWRGRSHGNQYWGETPQKRTGVHRFVEESSHTPSLFGRMKNDPRMNWSYQWTGHCGSNQVWRLSSRLKHSEPWPRLGMRDADLPEWFMRLSRSVKLVMVTSECLRLSFVSIWAIFLQIDGDECRRSGALLWCQGLCPQRSSMWLH